MTRQKYLVILGWFVFCCGQFFGLPTVNGQTSEEIFKKEREEMVQTAVIGAGIKSERVIEAIRSTPRHEFIPKKIRKTQSYLDAGIPIGESQTISSPFIVAYMTESLDPQPTDKVLEIGTGSGYQAAVLSPLVKEVYSIEIVAPLGERAAQTLKKLKYDNVRVKVGDGYLGWPEYAPFDKIIVTCSPEDIPQPLFDQLREGGLIVVPMGERHQQTLYRLKKVDGKLEQQPLRPTLFVPMTGQAEAERRVLPDPTKPTLINPNFEDGLDEEGFVKGWYYQRKLELKDDVLAPSGMYYVQFDNDVPGQLAHLMQGFAVDGREVPVIELTAAVACENVLPGPHKEDLPVVAVTFYDELRKDLGTEYIGPLQGTITWKNVTREIRVPVAAREAIVRIGLFGATGKASFDSISVRAKPGTAPKK
jgi:protein-L-isoaspartate(D-aspartate) O-methyltransferase